MSVIKRLSLYEFTLWGRDLVSVVRIRESPYYRGFYFFKKIYENFVGTLETVRNREVSVPRNSTVYKLKRLYVTNTISTFLFLICIGSISCCRRLPILLAHISFHCTTIRCGWCTQRMIVTSIRTATRVIR